MNSGKISIAPQHNKTNQGATNIMNRSCFQLIDLTTSHHLFLPHHIDYLQLHFQYSKPGPFFENF